MYANVEVRYHNASMGWGKYTDTLTVIENEINSNIRRSYHERIDGMRPLKLVFDIEREFDVAVWATLNEDTLVCEFLDVLFGILSTHNTPAAYDFYVWKMSRPTEDGLYRLSWHIMMANAFVKSHVHLSAIYSAVADVFAQSDDDNHPLYDCIDHISKTIFNLRMAGCYKGNARKQIRPSMYSVLDTGFVGLSTLPNEFSYGDTLVQPSCLGALYYSELTVDPAMLCVATKHAALDLSIISDKIVLHAVNTILESVDDSGTKREMYLEYRDVKGRFINFDILGSYTCDICLRDHEKDSPFGLICDDGAILLKCRRAKNNMSISIETRKQNGSGYGGYVAYYKYLVANWGIMSDICDRLTSIEHNPANIYYDDRYSEKYCRAIQTDYGADRVTYYIKSQLGTGKTNSINDYLNKSRSLSQLMISPRISLARAARARICREHGLKFDLYSDLRKANTPLATQLLVCQTDSISHITRDYEVVVLDEVESIFAQTMSSQMNTTKQADVQKKLIELIKAANVLIVSDGHISTDTINYIESIRTETDVYTIYNKMNAYSDYVAKLSITKKDWYGEVDKSLRNNERIVIAINTKDEMVALAEYIAAEYPHLSVGIYNADMDDRVRAQMFDNIDAEFGRRDIIIYTSTIGSGVSFDAERFDRIFGYFFAGCGTPIEAVQMLHRVRSVSQKSITLFIDQCMSKYGMDLPTTAEEVIETIMDGDEYSKLLQYYEETETEEERCSNNNMFKSLSSVADYMMRAGTSRSSKRNKQGGKYDPERNHMMILMIAKRNRAATNFTTLFLAELADEGMAAALIAPEGVEVPAIYQNVMERVKEVATAEIDAVRKAEKITAALIDEHGFDYFENKSMITAFKLRQHYGLYRNCHTKMRMRGTYFEGYPCSLATVCDKDMKTLMSPISQYNWANAVDADGRSVTDYSKRLNMFMENVDNANLCANYERAKAALMYLNMLGYKTFSREPFRVTKTVFNDKYVESIKGHLAGAINGKTVLSRELGHLILGRQSILRTRKIEEWTLSNVLSFLNGHFRLFDLIIKADNTYIVISRGCLDRIVGNTTTVINEQ
jgi:hypothetical protein